MSIHVKWDPDWPYKFSGDDILADDWEDAEMYMSGKAPLKQGGQKGLSPQELSSLREAAASVVGVSGRWSLQTSNSFRRIGTVRGDGNVLCGTIHHHDRHPDLKAALGVLDYIVAVQPCVVIRLIENLEDVTIKFLRVLDFAEIGLERQGELLEEISAAILEYELTSGAVLNEDRFASARKSLEYLREALVDIQLMKNQTVQNAIESNRE
jgi:hypothetical protein